ncbi:hypothetical protein M2284_002889 [Rhodococcus sp. LBL1]|nr:hypothetical protein [Rhodococcus sp. LBL1]MDH6684446.1 hypothetical protein [Rhodococcus sp. LBL2]
MTTSWVAGTVRARALARRRIGAAAARALTTGDSVADAVQALSRTPYGHDVRPHDSVAAAQRGVGSALLWHLRVLAGWLPRDGVDVVRLLSGGFEIADLDDRLAQARGIPTAAPYRLGALATAGRRLEGSRSAADVRSALRASAWGDPGGARPWEIACGTRLNWADQIVGRIPEAAAWARAQTALLLVRTVRVQHHTLAAPLTRRAETIVGPGFVDAVPSGNVPVGELARHLPADTRWVFDGLDRLDDAWRADARWCHRVEADGFALMRGADFGRGPVVGAIAVRAIDAWRVRAALSAAARRAVVGSDATEAFDAVA